MTTADATTVRSWARNNGFTTGDRGRLPAKVLDAYAAAHAGPAATASGNAVAKKATPPVSTGKAAGATATSQRATAPVTAKKRSPAKKKKTATLKGAATAAPDKKAPEKKVPGKKAATKSVPAGKASAAGSASKLVAPRVSSTRRAKTAAATSPVPASSARAKPAESSGAALESAPLHRLVALEKQVADLTLRLAAVESASGAAGSNGVATAAKPTRTFSRRQ